MQGQRGIKPKRLGVLIAVVACRDIGALVNQHFRNLQNVPGVSLSTRITQPNSRHTNARKRKPANACASPREAEACCPPHPLHGWRHHSAAGPGATTGSDLPPRPRAAPADLCRRHGAQRARAGDQAFSPHSKPCLLGSPRKACIQDLPRSRAISRHCHWTSRRCRCQCCVAAASSGAVCPACALASLPFASPFSPPSSHAFGAWSLRLHFGALCLHRLPCPGDGEVG